MVSDIFIPSDWEEVRDFNFEDITYHRAKKTGTVRIAINRPEVRNAFRPQTVDELYRALDHARMWSDVGSVILTGNGPSPTAQPGFVIDDGRASKKPTDGDPWAFGCHAMRGDGSVHPTHPASTRAGGFGFVFLDLRDDRIGGQQQAGDAGGVLQGCALDLRRNDDAHLHQIAIFVGQGVITEVDILRLLDLLGDDGPIDAGLF